LVNELQKESTECVTTMFEENPEWILYGVLGFAWLEFGWEAYLGIRQRRIYKEHTKPPPELKDITDEDTFEKARTYALDKSKFGSIQGLFSQTFNTVLIWLFAYKYLWDVAQDLNRQTGVLDPESEIHRSLTFIVLSNVLSTVIYMPFSVYSTFVLEQKHGFNKQTPLFFVKDQLKKFALMQAIMLPLVAAIIKIVQWGGEYFFIYLWLFVVAFSLFMLIVYPEFIAPLFDKYVPLPEGELKTQIEELAASIQFPLYKLFVVEGSKRSSHSNAYFYGFFNFKRIVLFDTLLSDQERLKVKTAIGSEEDEEKKNKEDEDSLKGKGCTNEEILAVLGHELGHWKLNHVLKNIIISQVHMFLMFAFFGYLYKQQLLYTAFGFAHEQPVLIGFMIILQFITAPYNAVLDFAMTCLSRRFEFQADDFAFQLFKRSDKLRSALIKLNNDNLGYPIYDWLYSAWNHSHPPIIERLGVLKAKDEKAQ